MKRELCSHKLRGRNTTCKFSKRDLAMQCEPEGNTSHQTTGREKGKERLERKSKTKTGKKMEKTSRTTIRFVCCPLVDVAPEASSSLPFVPQRWNYLFVTIVWRSFFFGVPPADGGGKVMNVFLRSSYVCDVPVGRCFIFPSGGRGKPLHV